MAGADLVSLFGAGRLLSQGLLAFALAALAGTSSASAADCKASPAPGVDWTECNKTNIVMKGARLQNARLAGTDFTLTDLRGADLRGADLRKATLVRSSLAGADASGADFARVEAYRTSFAGMNAPGASFASGELQRADFLGARLTEVDFEKAELGRANFQDAILDDTRFALANLSRASLIGASLRGTVDFGRAFMYLTRIEGLDLSSATGLDQDQIDLTCGNADTKLPVGLTPPSSWPCAFD